MPRLQRGAPRAHAAAAGGHSGVAPAHGGAAGSPAGPAARGLDARPPDRVRHPRGREGGGGGHVTDTVTAVSTPETASPSPLTVRLEEFEGPLDLLLHLARTAEIDL